MMKMFPHPVCKNSLYLLHLYQVPIFRQLQIEEALLRTDSRNWCLVNHGSPSAIVMGVSGKTDEWINTIQLEKKPVTLIRRFSGGGTVFIDKETLFITFICNTSLIPIQPYPRHIMSWTEKLYQPVFHPHPFRLEENDYVFGERKFGGNAQSICKERWLHHSSFLWDYQIENMDYLLLPKKAPTYRQGRAHSDFLCRLKEYWPEKKFFMDCFFKELEKNFTLKESDEKEIEEILLKPHRKATCIVRKVS